MSKTLEWKEKELDIIWWRRWKHWKRLSGRTSTTKYVYPNHKNFILWQENVMSYYCTLLATFTTRYQNVHTDQIRTERKYLNLVLRSWERVMCVNWNWIVYFSTTFTLTLHLILAEVLFNLRSTEGNIFFIFCESLCILLVIVIWNRFIDI